MEIFLLGLRFARHNVNSSLPNKREYTLIYFEENSHQHGLIWWYIVDLVHRYSVSIKAPIYTIIIFGLSLLLMIFSQPHVYSNYAFIWQNRIYINYGYKSLFIDISFSFFTENDESWL